MIYIIYENRIRALRVDADKTLEEIASILHCHREVYRRYEKGIREIPLWAAIELAKHYNVTLDYLLGISKEKRPFGC